MGLFQQLNSMLELVPNSAVVKIVPAVMNILYTVKAGWPVAEAPRQARLLTYLDNRDLLEKVVHIFVGSLRRVITWRGACF